MDHTVVELGPTDFVGLQIECPAGDTSAIPPLWERFWTAPGIVPNSQGVYGLSWCDGGDGLGYLAAHRVDHAAATPDGWVRKSIPNLRFAVWPFEGTSAEFGPAFDDIFKRRLGDAGLSAAEPALCLEFYPPECYDETTGICKADLYVQLA